MKKVRNLVAQNQATIMKEEFSVYFMRFFETVTVCYGEFDTFPKTKTSEFKVFLYNSRGEYVGDAYINGVDLANDVWSHLNNTEQISTAIEILGI